jgi:predicted ATP-binding protein involved in virulence
MYISKIALKDVRGFTDLNFDLMRPDGSYAGWTVFTGDNGSGKSTLLKAIAIALTGKETARSLQPSFHRWIREGQHEASIELGVVPDVNDDSFTEGGRVTDKEFLARLVLKNGLKEPTVLDLVLEVLRDELMPNQIAVDRIDSDGLWLKDRNGLQLSWSEMSDGYRAALALLADVLRHLIAVYGLTDLTDRDAQGKLLFKRSGVVLIDEIDAHLHPEWQREMGFWLTRHFPRIQFIVTTHSPLICQAASPNGLFVLPEPGSSDKPHALDQDEYNKVIAARPDTILLTSAFGLQNTRSPKAVEARAQYAKLKAKERSGATLSDEERREVTQLQLFARSDEAC